MSQLGLISVCMPVYNESKTIKKAIESVLNQTYQNFEIILVDNKSTDGTYEIISQFKDPRIKIYQNEKNIGWRLNSNEAFLLAKGEYVATLHGDDLFKKNYLGVIKNIFDKHPKVGVVHCIHETNKKKFFENKTIFKNNDYYSIMASLRREPAPTNTAYRNDAIKGTQYYSKDFWTCEARFFMEIALKGYDGYIHGECLCDRDIETNKTTKISKDVNNKILQFEQLLNFYHEYKNDTKIQEKHKEQIEERLIDVFNNLRRLKIKNEKNQLISEAYNKAKIRLTCFE